MLHCWAAVGVAFHTQARVEPNPLDTRLAEGVHRTSAHRDYYAVHLSPQSLSRAATSVERDEALDDPHPRHTTQHLTLRHLIATASVVGTRDIRLPDPAG